MGQTGKKGMLLPLLPYNWYPEAYWLNLEIVHNGHVTTEWFILGLHCLLWYNGLPRSEVELFIHLTSVRLMLSLSSLFSREKVCYTVSEGKGHAIPFCCYGAFEAPGKPYYRSLEWGMEPRKENILPRKRLWERQAWDKKVGDSSKMLCIFAQTHIPLCSNEDHSQESICGISV